MKEGVSVVVLSDRLYRRFLKHYKEKLEKHRELVRIREEEAQRWD